MVPWGCLCHTTTVMMDLEFQQNVDVVNSQALPRAPWRGECLCPTFCLCQSPGCWDKGLSDVKMLQVTRPSRACKRGEQHLLCHHCSSTSTLIAPHSLQMPGKTEFQLDILISLYLCSEAKHNSATKSSTKPCKWPCGSSRRVFCASSPFFDFQTLFL